MILSKVNAKSIGYFLSIGLLIPPNVGFNLYGVNLDDLPFLLIFFTLLYKKSYKLKLKKFDTTFLLFVFVFIIYTNLFVDEFKLFNQTNLRFYFYFLLCYLCVDNIQQNNDKLINIFEPLWIVIVANFILVIFQIQLPGSIDGWISNNTASVNPLTSGRLGGFQGGGPNVIGIICSAYVYVCLYKIISSNNPVLYFINNKINTILLIISGFNLLLTYSRGSYLALFVGVIWLLLFSDNFSSSLKIYLIIGISIISILFILIFPSIFLKQSNRGYLNDLGLKNVELFTGAGGGNYIKKIYKEYLITLDEKLLLETFNIEYSQKERDEVVSSISLDSNESIEGYLKLEFDHFDNFLPRSVISFYHSEDGVNWDQIGSNHTTGSTINLIQNDSFLEVGGWADGQSPGEEFLSGYAKSLTIKTDDYIRFFEFSEKKRGEDYFILTPKYKNIYENKIEYKANSLRLNRPRDYWIAIPNEVDLSSKDFEIILHLELNSIPKGHETLFSQSSILKLNEEFNDQSWKWSIIDGRMYFYWIENVDSGYSKFIGGKSLRTEKIIAQNGTFGSIISDFNLSQFDEITTSHNGFLTMSVEYGLFIVLIIFFLIIYLMIKNVNRKHFFEIGFLTILLIQNTTNDLIYSPDVAIYIWLIPVYLLNLNFKNQ